MSEQLANLAQQEARRPTAAQKSEAAQHVFRVLHGFYGNLFTAKFASGQALPDGGDEGLESAKAVWGHALYRFSLETVKDALAACLKEHAEYPPSLPQFVTLCQAKQPRQSYAQEHGLPALAAPASPGYGPISFEPKGDHRDWARRILAGVEAGHVRTPTVIRFARQALGLEP